MAATVNNPISSFVKRLARDKCGSLLPTLSNLLESQRSRQFYISVFLASAQVIVEESDENFNPHYPEINVESKTMRAQNLERGDGELAAADFSPYSAGEGRAGSPSPSEPGDAAMDLSSGSACKSTEAEQTSSEGALKGVAELLSDGLSNWRTDENKKNTLASLISSHHRKEEINTRDGNWRGEKDGRPLSPFDQNPNKRLRLSDTKEISTVDSTGFVQRRPENFNPYSPQDRRIVYDGPLMARMATMASSLASITQQGNSVHNDKSSLSESQEQVASREETVSDSPADEPPASQLPLIDQMKVFRQWAALAAARAAAAANAKTETKGDHVRGANNNLLQGLQEQFATKDAGIKSDDHDIDVGAHDKDNVTREIGGIQRPRSPEDSAMSEFGREIKKRRLDDLLHKKFDQSPPNSQSEGNARSGEELWLEEPKVRDLRSLDKLNNDDNPSSSDPRSNGGSPRRASLSHFGEWKETSATENPDNGALDLANKSSPSSGRSSPTNSGPKDAGPATDNALSSRKGSGKRKPARPSNSGSPPSPTPRAPAPATHLSIRSDIFGHLKHQHPSQLLANDDGPNGSQEGNGPQDFSSPLRHGGNDAERLNSPPATLPFAGSPSLYGLSPGPKLFDHPAKIFDSPDATLADDKDIKMGLQSQLMQLACFGGLASSGIMRGLQYNSLLYYYAQMVNSFQSQQQKLLDISSPFSGRSMTSADNDSFHGAMTPPPLTEPRLLTQNRSPQSDQHHSRLASRSPASILTSSPNKSPFKPPSTTSRYANGGLIDIESDGSEPRKRAPRALTGRYVRTGTAASPHVLQRLRRKIEERMRRKELISAGRKSPAAQSVGRPPTSHPLSSARGLSPSLYFGPASFPLPGKNF